MYIQGQFPWHKLASDGDKNLRFQTTYCMYNTYFFEHRKEEKNFQLHSSQVKTRAEMKWIRRFWIDWETGLRPGPLTNLSGFGNKKCAFARLTTETEQAFADRFGFHC